MTSTDSRSMIRQESLRSEIEAQVAEFLAKGGKIEKLEEPVFSLNKAAAVEQESMLFDDVF